MRRYIHFLPQALYILLAIIWTASLTACASVGGYPQAPETDANLQALKANYFAPNSTCVCNYDKLRLEYIRTKLPADAELLKAMRDEIVLSRVHVYDIEFSCFQRLLYGTGNTVTLGSDLAVLALSGFGAVTGGAATKSALSAASGGIVGAKGAVDKDLYYQKTLPALILQMEANRAKVKLAIFEGLKLPDAQYPLQRAESDLADLNDAGSIPNAISNITQTATEAKNETQDAIKAIDISRTPAAAKALGSAPMRIRVANLQAGIDKLSDAKALEFAKNPPIADKDMDDLLTAMYPKKSWLTDPAIARTALKIRVTMVKDPDVDIPKWEQDLK